MDLGLAGKVALVTGASKGIGRGIARALAAEGARVAISSRSRERIEAAAADVGARAYVHDMGDPDAAGELVANTGGPPGGADPLSFPREQWREAYRSLVLSPLALIGHTVPGMRERGFGRVVSVGSSAVREPIPGLMLSNAHRSGLLAALKTIATDVAADGVTVNSVLPGRIATDRIFNLAGSREVAEQAASETVPVGRLGTVEEFAAVATFLASAQAAYVTGTAVLVDGGASRAV